MSTQSVFTYLANTLRSGDREVPYSLVTATDLRSIAPSLNLPPDNPSTPAPIVVNDWTSRDLGVRTGDPLTLDGLHAPSEVLRVREPAREARQAPATEPEQQHCGDPYPPWSGGHPLAYTPPRSMRFVGALGAEARN